MKVACDHGGYELAKQIAQHYSIEYLGPDTLEPTDDYPVYAKKLCESLDDIGILICRSGHGMCIAANRYKHVRAVLIKNVEDAMKTRQHNHANVICLSADNTDFETAITLIDTFKSTAYDMAQRHCRRVNQL